MDKICGRYRMVVGFTTTYTISAYHHWSCEFGSQSGRGVQYVIKFVSEMRQVGGFPRVLRFPPPIKLRYFYENIPRFISSKTCKNQTGEDTKGVEGKRESKNERQSKGVEGRRKSQNERKSKGVEG